jgi:nucleoside-diphosphate-sugar epimerase
VLEHLNSAPRDPRRAVVLGAGGFVGGAIARRLAADGLPVKGIRRTDVDLLGSDAVARLEELLAPDDSVVFVSALAPARTATVLAQNVRMAEAVCAAVTATKISHFVYISSDAVYADGAGPLNERSCCAPSSLHGAMHAVREAMLRASVAAPLTILRPSLLYGAGDPHNGYGPNRFRRLAMRGEAITLFGEGEERRDHVFIEDLATIVALVLAHRSAGVLNIATGRSVSFREVAEAVAAQFSERVAVRGSPRQTPVTHRHFDVSALLSAFPTFQCTPLAEGLARAKQEEAQAG